MTTTSKRKNCNPLENCHKCAVNLFWKVRHVLEGLILYGQWTNLHDRAQNGPKPVTNAWIDWFHIFIIRVNTNSIAMWVILQKMQAGTVSRLWFCKRSWGLKIHFRRNIVLSGKLCSCSFNLDVWEQTSFSHSSTESKIMSLDAGFVKRIPLDTAIHEQNGYAKLLEKKYIFTTNVDNSDMTYTDKHNMREVWARLHAV